MSRNLTKPDIETQIEFIFIDAINLWRNKLGDLAKKEKISSLERRVIVWIARAPGMRQSELAELMDVEPQSLTRCLEGMEEKGWILKTDNATDKRAKSLNFTAEGEKIMDSVMQISDDIRPVILHDLSLEEKHFLVKILKAIKVNLKAIG
jgi:MarR family transcriptional regulator for hemolysin